MSASGRAKQFMPFAALNGLERALARQEALAESRFLTASEEKSEWKECVSRLQRGQRVCVTYLTESETVRQIGKVSTVEEDCERLFLDEIEISFEQILAVERI